MSADIDLDLADRNILADQAFNAFSAFHCIFAIQFFKLNSHHNQWFQKGIIGYFFIPSYILWFSRSTPQIKLRH